MHIDHGVLSYTNMEMFLHKLCQHMTTAYAMRQNPMCIGTWFFDYTYKECNGFVSLYESYIYSQIMNMINDS